MDVDEPKLGDEVAASEPKKKKEKKSKKSKENEDGDENLDLESLCPIAKPFADKKMSKRLLRTVKKASKARHLKRGVKEVVHSLRKGEKGLIVLAADISPIDIISHLPLMCEESSNPYIFIASRETLGAASATKRPTSVVMMVSEVKKSQKSGKSGNKEVDRTEEIKEYKEAYDDLSKEVRTLNTEIVLTA